MAPLTNLVSIDIQQVLNNIGYCDEREPSARIASLVNEYVDNACQLIAPSYSCVIRDVKSVQGACVTIENSMSFESKIISRLLEHCEKVALFAVTIGSHLEEMACRLAEDGLILQATVLDAIGSIAAEEVANIVQDGISKTATTHGLCTSQRFSPGYCDWDISQQETLFRVIDADAAGVHLTERCLMLPRKSISGIIGIGQCSSDVVDYNPCTTCKKRDCPGRRG